MATELWNIKRKYEAAEATLIAALLPKQWGYAEDTRRITVMEDDGTTERYFWDATRLADQTTSYGTAIIGTPGITGVTPSGGSSGAAGTLQAMLSGGFSGAGNTNFLATAPASSTRNTLQPSGDYIGLRLKNNASQTNEIFRIENSAATRLAYVDASGHWYTNYSNVGATNIVAVGNGDNTNTASHAQFLANVGGASGGDPKFTAQVTSGSAMSIGIDNSASDAAVWSYSTALGTSNLISSNASAMTITPAVTTVSTLTVGNGSTFSNLYLNGAAGNARIAIAQTNGTIRWEWGANGTTESGSNAGSAWVLGAYSDAGSLIDYPITVTRASGGTMTLARPVSMSSTLGVTGNVTVGSGSGAPQITVNGAAGNTRGLELRTGGSIRWYLYAGSTAESGSDAGSSFRVSAYTDAGAYIDDPISITRVAGGGMTLSRPTTFTAAPVFNSVTASQFLLVDGSKALTSVAGTGSGSVVRATSPTISGLTLSGTTATGLTASRTLITDGSGNMAVNTETGTGSHVRATSPTLVTPVLGAATGTSLTLSGLTGTGTRLVTATAAGALGNATTIAGAYTFSDAQTFSSTATIAGNIVGSGSNLIIRTDTSDGSDSKGLFLTGGGAYASNGSRGAGIALLGNENASPGTVNVIAGSASGASIILQMRDDQAGAFFLLGSDGTQYLTVDTSNAGPRLDVLQLAYFDDNVRVGHAVGTDEPLLGVGGEIGFGGTEWLAASPSGSGTDRPDEDATPQYVQIKRWNGSAWVKLWLRTYPNETTP